MTCIRAIVLCMCASLCCSSYAIDNSAWVRFRQFFKNVNEDIKDALEKEYNEAQKTVKQVSAEISKAGGFISKEGVKVGQAIIKGFEQSGDVVLDLGGKAGHAVLKIGQSVVSSTGMVLLNTGGIVLALTKGDQERIASCKSAVDASWRYGVSTTINESLKAVGSIDMLATITGISFEISTADLAAKKTPMFSVTGSFLGHDFQLKDVHLDLKNPDGMLRDLLEELIRRREHEASQVQEESNGKA
jgi:hypothetical protein